MLNGAKMNYDGKLDFSILSDAVTVYDDTAQDQVLERVTGCGIVVTKEMPVGAELLARFPDSVYLLCEAGTGYNNIDLAAARARGITVCNIPAYSTQRVAHTAVMLLLNLASSMRRQLDMLSRGDRSNFTGHLQCPHAEVNGKTLGVIGAGHIGKEVIRVARALDMEVLASPPRTTECAMWGWTSCSPAAISSPSTAPSATRPATSSTPIPWPK